MTAAHFHLLVNHFPIVGTWLAVPLLARKRRHTSNHTDLSSGSGVPSMPGNACMIRGIAHQRTVTNAIE